MERNLKATKAKQTAKDVLRFAGKDVSTMKKAILIFIVVMTAAIALATGASAADKYAGSASEIDATTADKGYVTVKYTGGGTKAIKVRIQKGEATYTYDLDVTGKAEVYPLQLGDGAYSVKVLRNTSGTSYAVLQKADFTIKLENQNAPFLLSHQIVNYTADSNVTKKAAELTADITDPLKKVDAVYKYITELLTYDKEKAATVKSGYVPSVDKVLESKKGICYDYSSVMAAMLRSQGIPTKLIMGYVAPTNVYHAWNEVYIEGKGWIETGKLYFDGEKWRLMDATFQSSGGSSKEVQKLIGDGTSYSTKYEY